MCWMAEPPLNNLLINVIDPFGRTAVLTQVWAPEPSADFFDDVVQEDFQREQAFALRPFCWTHRGEPA